MAGNGTSDDEQKLQLAACYRRCRKCDTTFYLLSGPDRFCDVKLEPFHVLIFSLLLPLLVWCYVRLVNVCLGD